jgi:hypothetical protein
MNQNHITYWQNAQFVKIVITINSGNCSILATYAQEECIQIIPNNCLLYKDNFLVKFAETGYTMPEVDVIVCGNITLK